MLARALHVELRVEQHPEAPGDVPRTCADLTLARAELDYAPETPIEEGIRRFAGWFVERGVQ
jgi:UDP-glucuronate 4-epimerase